MIFMCCKVVKLFVKEAAFFVDGNNQAINTS